MELYNAIHSDVSQGYVKATLESMINIIDIYGLSSVSLCFNGGKDCTVLLHLLVAALAFIRRRDGKSNVAHDIIIDIPVVYFMCDEEFDELHQFNKDMMELYKFNLIGFDGSDMKECLKNMLDYYPDIKAIFMGQRMGDPGSVYLAPVQHSDPSWPPITRVNSILNWTYDMVWKFLVSFSLPYCRLYELGYTSLGPRVLTLPNPQLLKPYVFSKSRTCLLEKHPSDVVSMSVSSILPERYEDFLTRTQNSNPSHLPVTISNTDIIVTSNHSLVKSEDMCSNSTLSLKSCVSMESSPPDCHVSQSSLLCGAMKMILNIDPPSVDYLHDSLLYTIHYVYNNSIPLSRPLTFNLPSSFPSAPSLSPHFDPLTYFPSKFCKYNSNHMYGVITISTSFSPVSSSECQPSSISTIDLAQWPYMPAYALLDPDSERSGRVSKCKILHHKL